LARDEVSYPKMPVALQPRHHSRQLRGLNFHWVEWGDEAAPPVVLLHGLGAMCRIWDWLAADLQDRYRLIALDQRGHGDTSWPDEPAYSTDDYVGDLEGLIDVWGLDRFKLTGLSMGGMNAMAYTAAHPERVEKLCVVDIRPALNPDKRPNRDQDRMTAEQGHPQFPDLEAAFAWRKLSHPHTPDESIRHHVEHLLKPSGDGRSTYKHDPRVSYYWKPRNLWNEIPRIDMPVLIVRGGQSMVLPDGTAAEMKAAFPRAELVTVAKAGHTVPEDAPVEFNQALAEFFAG
jgi:pimeloyl-ACP methyl ester carboxylesterase